MRVDDLDYSLPPERIAHAPAARREDARLLVLRRPRAALQHDVGADDDTSIEHAPLEHARMTDLVRFLAPNDLVVVNDTRVLAARLQARRASGGAVEVLFLEPAPGDTAQWYALLRAGGRLRAGEELKGPGGSRLTLGAAEADGRRRVQVEGLPVDELLESHGQMPLPPYIERQTADDRHEQDRERYQTVYARVPGAVAAPTAGLHLTAALLAALRARGIGVAPLTLHVGLGTFAPIRVDDLDDHPMHSERLVVPQETAQAVARTREKGGRVLAVGTTSVRALEAAAQAAAPGPLAALRGRTQLLIQPGYRFRVVDALLTNFHLPRSTLLALVCALAGRERILAAYREAIAQHYRFYSYGDAMLIL